MLFNRLLPIVFLGLSSFTMALPLKERDLQPRTFVEQAYANFQISDGVAGNAKAQAAAVFVTPFDGVDLSTVCETERDAVEAMRKAAEDAEKEEFDPQIAAASGATAAALSVGKTKNKVLKLTGEVQRIQIDIARAKAEGQSTMALMSELTEKQTKLTKNIGLDVANAGKASKGVA